MNVGHSAHLPVCSAPGQTHPVHLLNHSFTPLYLIPLVHPSQSTHPHIIQLSETDSKRSSQFPDPAQFTDFVESPQTSNYIQTQKTPTAVKTRRPTPYPGTPIYPHLPKSNLSYTLEDIIGPSTREVSLLIWQFIPTRY